MNNDHIDPSMNHKHDIECQKKVSMFGNFVLSMTLRIINQSLVWHNNIDESEM